MKIFISQSGDRSNALAHQLKELVRLLVNEAEPWVSDEGIEKGTRSLTVLAETLEGSVAGIICLTSENLTEPWILFEAGALSKRQRDHVWTVLLDIENEQVEPPLGQFQHSKADKDDLYKVIQSINGFSPKPKPEGDLKTIFEALWPQFGPAIEEIRKQAPKGGVRARRLPEEISLEALSTSREVLRRVEEMAARTDKTFLIVAAVYKAIFDSPAPTFRELLNQVRQPSQERIRNAVLGTTAGMPLTLRELAELGKLKDKLEGRLDDAAVQALSGTAQSTEPSEGKDN
jgi:hypothetical protein